jgi:hypothetical protein
MDGLRLIAVDAGPFMLERSKLVPFASKGLSFRLLAPRNEQAGVFLKANAVAWPIPVKAPVIRTPGCSWLSPPRCHPGELGA